MDDKSFSQDKFYAYKPTKGTLKSELHRELTNQAKEVLIERENITSKFARKVVRNLIKKKIWEERKSKKSNQKGL